MLPVGLIRMFSVGLVLPTLVVQKLNCVGVLETDQLANASTCILPAEY